MEMAPVPGVTKLVSVQGVHDWNTSIVLSLNWPMGHLWQVPSICFSEPDGQYANVGENVR